MCKNTNKKLVLNNNLVSGIHDRILIENESNLSDAYNDACVWIAELQLQLDSIKGKVSSGFVRHDTSKLKWNPKRTVAPVDAGDAWVKTGADYG